MPKRAGSDSHRIARGPAGHARRRAWIEDLLRSNDRIKDEGFLFEKCLQMPLVEREGVRSRDLGEYAHIVISKVPIVVVLPRQGDAEPGQDRLIGAEMQWFRIGEHAVEVEDDGFDHGAVLNHSEGLRPSDSPSHSLAGAPRSPRRWRGLTRALVRHCRNRLRSTSSAHHYAPCVPRRESGWTGDSRAVDTGSRTKGCSNRTDGMLD